jgi:hypothetical protein
MPEPAEVQEGLDVPLAIASAWEVRIEGLLEAVDGFEGAPIHVDDVDAVLPPEYAWLLPLSIEREMAR